MLTKDAYPFIIAGAVPVSSQSSPIEIASMIAREQLGTDQVHILLSKEKVSNRIAWLGLPSSVMGNEVSPMTPIAAALPGHPDHQGEGVYVLEVGPYKVAATYYDEVLSVLCNETPLVDEYIADVSLPVYVCETLLPWRFESIYTITKSQSEVIAKQAIRYSNYVAAFACFVLVVSAIASGALRKVESRSADMFENSIQQAINDIRTASPLNEQLAIFQTKASVAIRAGGWVDHYEVKEGKESFRIYMPQWVTRDYVLALGDQAKADKTITSDSLVQIVKGTPAAEQIVAKNQGETPR